VGIPRVLVIYAFRRECEPKRRMLTPIDKALSGKPHFPLSQVWMPHVITESVFAREASGISLLSQCLQEYFLWAQCVSTCRSQMSSRLNVISQFLHLDAVCPNCEPWTPIALPERKLCTMVANVSDNEEITLQRRNRNANLDDINQVENTDCLIFPQSFLYTNFESTRCTDLSTRFSIQSPFSTAPALTINRSA
jgi:hypothetical protein